MLAVIDFACKNIGMMSIDTASRTGTFFLKVRLLAAMNSIFMCMGCCFLLYPSSAGRTRFRLRSWCSLQVDFGSRMVPLRPRGTICSSVNGASSAPQ